eukprot:m.266120 g.266120  ORF g.266120 m.266120 type:complete len:105 (+) comp54693_c0_seq7:114-428(+)
MTGNVAAGAVPHADLGLMVNILIGLALTELFFFPIHRLLHQSAWLAKYHVCHHSSRAGGYFQAVTFHPLDLVLEFTAAQIICQVFWCVLVASCPHDIVLSCLFD